MDLTPKKLEPGQKRQRIVSSAHLVSPKSPELSEIEFGLIIATNAFNRWMIRCMTAAGAKDLTPTELRGLEDERLVEELRKAK